MKIVMHRSNSHQTLRTLKDSLKKLQEQEASSRLCSFSKDNPY